MKKRLICGCLVAADVRSVGRAKVDSVDRTWKIVYGTADGPEGRALELLSGELGTIYAGDHVKRVDPRIANRRRWV